MITRAIARNLARAMTRRVVDRVMDRVGGKLITGLADTSADAPNAFFEPKRDLYRELVENGASEGILGETSDR